MIIAVYIKSESCDECLYLEKDITPLEMYEKLKEDIDSFRPICNYLFSTFDASDEEIEDFVELMDKLENESWCE